MSVKRKAWDLNPHNPKVARFSKPARRAVSGYLPYLYKSQWTDRELNPPHRSCKGQSPPAAYRPVFVRGPSGSRTRSPSLPRTCATRTPTDRCFSDPGWNRTITLLHVTQASSPLDHGIISKVTEVGVEPTKSPRPQRDRFASLRTRSFSSSGSWGRTRRSRLMRPA